NYMEESLALFQKKDTWPLIGTFFLSLAVVGFSAFIGSISGAANATAIIILSITSLGIVLSFVKKIRKVKYTFQLGMYIIYVFSMVVASMADLSQLSNIDWGLMSFIVLAIIGSIALHAIFCKIMGIDTDTFIITSVAAVCSPPFVPVVAGALKNKSIILSGLTTGIIGYAIGNYLGISLAYLFNLI
ncbi:MAG: DUF819 family protein, partial [Candidatus Marinimicrobia bacterium]|nr:DUF819 family protein [Candidatus Neomarinimicrobiota bacterium]